MASQIGIPCYDKQILDRIAAETGLAPGYIKEASEYASANNSLLWNLVMGRRKGDTPEENPANMVYFAQARIIRELAEKEPCVIVGRCSDYILRDRTEQGRRLNTAAPLVALGFYVDCRLLHVAVDGCFSSLLTHQTVSTER